MAAYTSLAAEYYDETQHPTCANFEELSRLFLEPQLTTVIPKANQGVELGAGRSIVAPLWKNLSQPTAQLVLVDNSPAMLEYSREWLSNRVTAIIADARETRLPDRSADIIVSSLGDPYNTPEFWFEIERLLSIDGICLFTTPSVEWARLFRPRGETEKAEFKLRDGSVMCVPSLVHSREDQQRLIESAGLRIIREMVFGVNYIRGQVSPKILQVIRQQDVPAMRGYRIARA
jgi:SAM-dependent methyltransferase